MSGDSKRDQIKEDIAFEVLRDAGKRHNKAVEMRKAEMLARNMTPVETEASVERLKDEAVRAFFGEEGIPPDLKKGWAIYEQRRKERDRVEAPLPPGGCLLLGREATVAGAMAEAHMKLAAALHIDTRAIKLSLKRDEANRINLIADVSPPDDWVIPIAIGNQAAQTPQEAAKVYIQSVLRQINLWFRTEVGVRLEASEKIRPELSRPVAPWAGHGQA